MTYRYEVRMQDIGNGDTMGSFSDLENAKAVMNTQLSHGSKWAKVYDLEEHKNVAEVGLEESPAALPNEADNTWVKEKDYQDYKSGFEKMDKIAEEVNGEVKN
jgi:hypothetical protein